MAAGGQHEPSNVLVLCKPCHLAQHGKVPVPAVERSPEPNVLDVLRASIAEIESRPPGVEPLLPAVLVPELNKWGDPIDTVYDEDDPRSWT